MQIGLGGALGWGRFRRYWIEAGLAMALFGAAECVDGADEAGQFLGLDIGPHAQVEDTHGGQAAGYDLAGDGKVGAVILKIGFHGVERGLTGQFDVSVIEHCIHGFELVQDAVQEAFAGGFLSLESG